MVQKEVSMGIVFGSLLAIFFVAGFFLNHSFFQKTPLEKTVIPQKNYTPEQNEKEEKEDFEEVQVTQEKALSKAIKYLQSKTPPFIVNASTVSVNKDKRMKGVGYFYNWTVAFTVEPNSFGDWATNETFQRTFNFYVSPGGDYIFYAPPESTEVVEKAPRGLVYRGA